MKISIVTISFNQACFLEQAICSVLDQNYPHLEYIVVDPGSTDGSRNIIERYRSRIDKIVFEPDKGPADGLNRGFSLASGEIFGFINADDYLLPGALKQVAQEFADCNKDVVSGHSYIVDENGNVLRRFYSRRFSPRAYVYGAAMIAQPSTFFRSSSFRRSKKFNIENRIAWDAECWVEMAMTGATFSRLDSFLACFRVYPNSISGSGQMLGQRAVEYRDRIFIHVMGRPREAIDWLIRILMKIFEYGAHPRAAIERIFWGKTISVNASGHVKSAPVPTFRSDATYLVYVVFGMPIFAVWTAPKYLRRVVLGRYQGSTRKRAVYKSALACSMIAGVDHLFGTITKAPLYEFGGYDFDLDTWLEDIRKHFGIADLAAGIVWPKRWKSGRVYVHLLNHGRPIGFAKLSLNSGTDSRLSREAVTLREMGRKKWGSFCLPKLLMEGSSNGCHFLLVEALPVSVRPLARQVRLFPKSCVAEYSGVPIHIEAKEVPNLSWWSRYRERADGRFAEFDAEMNSILDIGFEVCRAHGDLSSHNVFLDGRETWIGDWDESVPDAPLRTDEVSFGMSMSISNVRANPVRGTKKFKTQYLTGIGKRERLDIMMALAFRHAAAIDDASLIIANWGEER